MKTLFYSLALVVTLCLPAIAAEEFGTASGTLTVAGDVRELRHAQLESGMRNSLWLTLSTAPADAVSVYELPKGGGAGVFLVIDRETQRIVEFFPSVVLHPGQQNENGVPITNAPVVLSLERVESDSIAGSATLAEQKLDGVLISFSVKFNARIPDPCTELGKLTVVGADDAPSKAVGAFFEAVAECRWDELEDLLSGEMLESFRKMRSTPDSISMFIGMVVVDMPRLVTILKSTVEGKQAQVTIQLGRPEGPTTAMTVEKTKRRKWKIVESDLIRF